MSEEPKLHLGWGPESTEYENSLVGNKAGLEAFATSIQAAIESGEAETSNKAFVDGIYCKPDSFFESLEEDRELGPLGKAIAATVFFAVLAFLILGMYTAAVFLWRWLS